VNIDTNSAMEKNNCYLLSWDMYGLEAVIDVTEWERRHEQAEKERVWGVLGSEGLEDPGNQVERNLNQIVTAILMRARVNSQRHYEVYTVQTDSGISADDMKRMFEDNPQIMADLVRERGKKLWGDRISAEKIVIC
jgi:hypothetical protein